MTSSTLDLSQTVLPRRIQENMIVFLQMAATLPGMVVHNDDALFWCVSNQPSLGNVVLRTRFSTDDAERQIDALLNQLGQQTDKIDWFVFPGDQPADLNQRLEARGMPGGPGGHWLWADLTKLADAPKVSPAVSENFHIERVRDDQMLAEWVRVAEAGFDENLAGFYDAYAAYGYAEDAFSVRYIGYLGDIPVSSAALLEAGGGATIYDVSTLTDFRHQGVGGANTHHLMQEIRRRGHTDTWIWSSPMAKSLYQKLGYVDADFGLREHTWHKSSVSP